MSQDPSAADIIAFWKEAGPKKWWSKDEGLDAEIRERFFGRHSHAANGALDHWQDTAEGALALVLLLDQFSRNLFRETAHGWAFDRQGLAVAKRAIADGLDMEMDPDLRNFIYLPFMHSEVLADQRACLRHMERGGEEGNIKAALEHLDIIERFGRFPHRNVRLGRKTSLEEQAFLDGGGFKG
ncbi:DUF924 family protein [Ahrensia sp. R2A130]|uniref:DUF924 family protein n=1 Tax=Ahrensia sp. R2A130 TaxID=744979 RepID=UPI0001E0F111|nr:DUF924 family protein [Ahrensia sp. R2A130]EFL88054.1 conserved hypothetical protein [Ahrensia sp. R2A130]